ncbi:MAG: beta-ketoacyl-ACP synthase [Myxococcales bacterium FL481]|nr:MAG: beta-ketoacyl-ACP synthase [Myxococcales bacterium FL481]
MSAPRRRLAISAYGCCCALGSSRDEIVNGLARGTTRLAPPDTVTVPFPTHVGTVRAELPELPSELSPWSTRLARMAARLVADIEPQLRRARSRWPADRIAVILGTSTAGAATTEAAFAAFVRTGVLPDVYDFRRQHTFGAPLHVVATLAGAAGPRMMMSTACTSSAKPFASAMRLIEAGAIDAAIVGGVDTLCAMTLQGFRSLGALDREPSRPFAAERNGISIGEGGALALVEREAEPRAWLEGVGESSDAYHVSAPHPEGLGARLAMERALAAAGQDPSAVDHINAHGTGTRLNDAAEGHAIAQLFGPDVPVASTKGYAGHLLGGAGAAEVVFSIMALEEQWAPASAGAAPIDPNMTINVLTQQTRGRFRRVLSNGFAFGGNNVSIVVAAP